MHVLVLLARRGNSVIGAKRPKVQAGCSVAFSTSSRKSAAEHGFSTHRGTPFSRKARAFASVTPPVIITTRAADAVGHIHDRMPMTVPPDRWDAWLDPTLTDGACDLLQPPGAALEAYAVSRLVSTVGNDGPELIEPLHES